MMNSTPGASLCAFSILLCCLLIHVAAAMSTDQNQLAQALAVQLYEKEKREREERKRKRDEEEAWQRQGTRLHQRFAHHHDSKQRAALGSEAP
jgi:hypothetical protein